MVLQIVLTVNSKRYMLCIAHTVLGVGYNCPPGDAFDEVVVD